MTRPVAFRSPRRLARLVVLFVLGLVAGLLSASTASAATTFTSTIVNQANGNCATVPNGTSAVQLTLAGCNSGAGQSFTFTPFGLPDSTSTDGTPMSASFYNYPNTHFNQSQKTAILNGPYGSFLF